MRGAGETGAGGGGAGGTHPRQYVDWAADTSHPQASCSVAQLVGSAGEGDQAAWRELVRRFDGMIGAVGRRYGLGHADVAELRQTTWLRLVEHLGRIEQPERIGGWLATTARRESLRMLSQSARTSPGAEHLLTNATDWRMPEVDARALTAERDACLVAAWGRLKPRCQRLLALLVADGEVSYQEISRMLDMPVGSIGPTRGRCLEHLRQLVAEEGLLSR